MCIFEVRVTLIWYLPVAPHVGLNFLTIDPGAYTEGALWDLFLGILALLVLTTSTVGRSKL